jgi:hypothetical protein
LSPQIVDLTLQGVARRLLVRGGWRRRPFHWALCKLLLVLGDLDLQCAVLPQEIIDLTLQGVTCRLLVRRCRRRRLLRRQRGWRRRWWWHASRRGIADQGDVSVRQAGQRLQIAESTGEQHEQRAHHGEGR